MNESAGSHVFFVVHGLYPMPGQTVTGNGVRAWGLSQGLKHFGHRITWATPEETAWSGWDKSKAPDIDVLFFRTAADLNEAIQTSQPDVLVIINWEFVEWLSEGLDIPMVLDLIAPRLLEMQFEPIDSSGLSTEILRYLNALSRGSRFLCSTERQKAFYHSWLMMSGLDCRDEIIDVVPISAAAPSARRSARRRSDPTFVHGGVSWPWQGPSRYLNQLLRILEGKEQGQLLVIGGAYPLAGPEDRPAHPTAQLSSSPRLVRRELLPYDEMEKVFSSAHVAVDLADRNPERELSFSYRMIEYLRCGLPVICNHYLDIAGKVSAYQAGWVINTEDNNEAFEDLIHEILSQPELVSERSANALRLIREQFNWEETTEPLARFCSNPKAPTRREHVFNTLLTRSHKFEKKLTRHQKQLSQQEAYFRSLNENIQQVEKASRAYFQSLSENIQQVEKASRAYFQSLSDNIERVQDASREADVHLHGRLQELVEAQERIEYQIAYLGVGGLLRWLLRIPGRVFRVLIKPLFCRWNSHNIAIITRSDLFPPHHGAAVRILEISRALSHHCQKVFLITGDRTRYFVFEKGNMHEAQFPKLLHSFPFSTASWAESLLRRREVPSVERFLWSALYDINYWVRTLFVAYQYGIALYQAEFPAYLRPAQVAKGCFGGKTALVEHNIEFSRIAETGDLSPNGHQFLKRIETQLCNRADFVITMSDVDRDILLGAEVQADKVTTIPHGVDLGRFKGADPQPLKKKYRLDSETIILVYHGIYSYAPNLQAVKALGEVILPALKKEGLPVVCLAIGTNPPSESPHAALRFLGGVDDIAAHLEICHIAVVPLTAGGGTRMKLLDYFAARVPVVCTKKAAEGLPMEEGVHAIVVDRVDEMVEPIIQLIQEPDRGRELADRAYALVQEYDWSSIAKRHMQLYQLPWWRS